MEHHAQQLGSPSFLIVMSTTLAPAGWNAEDPSTLKPGLPNSVFMATERFPSASPHNEPSQGADAYRSQDEAAAIASGLTPEYHGAPHSPQSISESENMVASLPLSSLSATSIMDSLPTPPPPADSVTDVDPSRAPPTRALSQCDADNSSYPTSSAPPRPSICSNYQSAAAEAISRFRPTCRDVIIGVAPHLFDERAKRPNEAPRSNVPMSYYDDRGRVRPSPLRYTIDFDQEEEKEKVPHYVKAKKSLVSKLAEDFVFGDDKSKSSRTRAVSSSLIGSSHRASIIDINLDGPPKSKRTKSSPNIRATPSSVPPMPELEAEKPQSRLKRWTSFKKSGSDSKKEKPEPKPKVKTPKVEEDCGICYPRCSGDCGQITFAKYDRKERRERRARAAGKTGAARGVRDFRNSPEWKEYREAQAWSNRVEPEKDVFVDRPSTSRSKSESNLQDHYGARLTVVQAVNDSPDSTPEDSPSSSNEDLTAVSGADKDKFRWRGFQGLAALWSKSGHQDL